MASRKAGLTWTADQISPKLLQALPKAERYLAKTTVYYSLRTEAYARKRARWTDRTGNARSGLSSEYRVERGTYSIDLYHRVPYGIWLEVRWGGRYAIIEESISVEGQKFFNAANNLIATMFGGE